MKDTIISTTPAASDDTNLEVKFTQADIDKAVADSVFAERLKFPSDTEMNALLTSSAQLNDMTARAEIAETKLTALSLGARPDCIYDVINLARFYVSDDVSLDNAIAAVIQKYPHFVGSNMAHSTPNLSTAMPFAPSLNSSLNGVEQAFAARNPWVKL